MRVQSEGDKYSWVKFSRSCNERKEEREIRRFYFFLEGKVLRNGEEKKKKDSSGNLYRVVSSIESRTIVSLEKKEKLDIIIWISYNWRKSIENLKLRRGIGRWSSGNLSFLTWNRNESKVLHNFLDTIKEERNWIILGKVLKNRAKEEKKSLPRYHRFPRCDEKKLDNSIDLKIEIKVSRI